MAWIERFVVWLRYRRESARLGLGTEDGPWSWEMDPDGSVRVIEWDEPEYPEEEDS